MYFRLFEQIYIYFIYFWNQLTSTHRQSNLMRGFTFTQRKIQHKNRPDMHTAINEYKLIYANAFNCKCAQTVFAFCKHAIWKKKWICSPRLQTYALLLLLLLLFVSLLLTVTVVATLFQVRICMIRQQNADHISITLIYNLILAYTELVHFDWCYCEDIVCERVSERGREWGRAKLLETFYINISSVK